jgi:translation initiation factor IF-3
VPDIPIKDYKINEQIRAREIFLIDDLGEQVGVRPTGEAIQLSKDRGFDLVEVAPQSKPPVCRMMDYGQYKYSQSKKDREARKMQTVTTLREVRFRTMIADHDKESKIRQVKSFLSKGSKVKLTVMFKGREIARPDRGVSLLRSVAEEVKDFAKVDSPPSMEGRRVNVVLSPVSVKNKINKIVNNVPSKESDEGKEADKE